MKKVKVSVTKTIGGGGYKFNYPAGYDSSKVMVEGYEHHGDPAKNKIDEFCLGVVNDDFVFGEGMVELTDEEYATELAIIRPAA